ncbi:hypothetical protein JRQ81_001737, partial [Phrynocephalus forsythii]
GLEEDFLEEFTFFKVLSPPKTTPLTHPMDQQAISNFKKSYTWKHFCQCFDD